MQAAHAGGLSLGAGTLKTLQADFENWIAHTDAIKPEVEMPSYDYLDGVDLFDLAQFLRGLE